MATTTDDLRPWLGPAYTDLTTEQLERLCAEADRIHAYYPKHDDRDLRESALTAAVQYLLGDSTADELRRELDRTRRTVAVAMAASKQYASMAKTDAGRALSEKSAAEAVGIVRETLREYMGLQR